MASSVVKRNFVPSVEGLALPAMPVRLQLSSWQVAVLEGGNGGNGGNGESGEPGSGSGDPGSGGEGGTPDPDG
ncbi:MAG: hypothetical protein SNJ58_04860 [Aggregatilineales bacterium]